jgi:hypothetical protein
MPEVIETRRNMIPAEALTMAAMLDAPDPEVAAVDGAERDSNSRS